MGKTKVIQLSDPQRPAFENGYRHGTIYAFRERCQMFLLKSERRTNSEIAYFLNCHKITIHVWVKHYQAEGIEGLKMHPGRGRRAMVSASTDLGAMRYNPPTAAFCE